jgi:glutathione-specific gamma-glutamylcyclotransferase
VSGENGLWVFGYGSLMWRPGFAYDEAAHATIAGLHRALCIYSHVHRGTPRLPGLVLGLDAGGRCEGIAYHVAAENAQRTLVYLRRREQQNNVYRPVFRTITLRGEERRDVHALCYAVRRDHRQYAGRLPLEIQDFLVRRSRGKSGRNIDYVMNTVRHLRECGIRDMELEALANRFGRRHDLPRGIV